MSQTLDYLKRNKHGYESENYEEYNITKLSDILAMEMIVLGNIDIPLYLEKHSVIDLQEYHVSDNEFNEYMNKLYSNWLILNRYDEDSQRMEQFRAECEMYKLQNNAKEIINIIVEKIEHIYNCDEESLTIKWLTTKEMAQKMNSKDCVSEFDIPNDFTTLIDVDKEGVLIVCPN